MAKRLTKDQLETDPLLTSYYLFISFFKRNLTAFIAVAVAFVVIIGGGIAYYLHSQSQEQDAQELLVFAEQAFQEGNYDLALHGDGVNVQYGLIDIINDYGRTRAGNLARYYAALAESELGNDYDALKYIERFNPPTGILGVGPITFHATILTNIGEYKKAADTFVKAAEWDENNSTTPQNLLNAAVVSIESQDTQRAKELLDRILSNYEDSDAADEARRLQGVLIVHN